MPHSLLFHSVLAFLFAALVLAAAPAQGQDLVINEFLADPSSYEGGEFVEIYNGSDEPVALDGYMIGDKENADRYTFGDVTLQPGEYATILGNSDSDVPGFTDDEFLGLNNTGDTITLTNNEDNVVDEYVYSGDEVVAGISQARNPNGTGDFELQDSFNENNAAVTPGEDNETGGDESNTAAPGDLIVAEFMANPEDVSDADGEYLEVYNDTDADIDLSGYTVSDDGANSFDVNSEVIVPAKGFAVLCENDEADANGGIDNCDYDYPNDFSLGNGDDEVIFGNESGTEVTRVEYTDGNAFGAGVALELAAFADGTDAQTAQAGYQAVTINIDGNGTDLGSPGGLGAAVYASGDAGWRMLSAPVAGMTVQDLADQNLVQGIDGSQYPNADPNLYTGYDGNYVKPSSIEDTLVTGQAFYWYLFEEAQVPETDPLPDSLTSPVSDGPTGDVDVDVTPTGQNFFLLGNPYDSDYDLSGLGDLAQEGFQHTVQVWNPNDGESGSYVMKDSDAGDLVSAWQGFFAERTTASEGTTQLTFSEGAQVAGGADFIGGSSEGDGSSSALASARAASQPQRRVLPLRLTGHAAAGDVTSFDRAARLYFHPQAVVGGTADVWDATKLTPFTSGAFATIALQMDGQLKAQEGLPYTPGERVEVPVVFTRSGTEAGEEFTIAWPQDAWVNIPESWTLTLADQETGATVDLRAKDSYTFAPAPGGNSAAAVRTAANASGRSVQLRSLTLEDALSQAGGGGNTAKPSAADSTPPARFVLAVEPDASIPVEAAGLTATTDGRDAVLSWRTLTETGNDRFTVERRVGEGTWKEVASVESQAPGGTSNVPIRYRARVEALDYGRHAFRLRQIDRDGGEALVGETQHVEIELAEAYVLSAVYPNPFVERATVEVAVREAQDVTVALYDVRGRRLKTLHDGPLPASETKRLTLEAAKLASGLYIVRLHGERETRTQTVTLVR